ncbi:MAG: AAA family ATPase [Minisyncoccia bacterium]
MAHFLKKLELNGFKSFAQKTVLEFPSGIVAIVGPNGSGKSNVVDAIRWLLGEREAKNLRGGKVEDLIFAGTQKRARVGMASASLHFENSQKFFPVDFEEVVVTRQISRGGESKYFLNKSEILLRDLVDFFAKARLGSRGLIIIGQGDSDLFIRSTPMERREMIEEILGLREYQLKKADAERRLKNSRINLDKTKALVEEILPHLRSLKRQTGRWEKRGVFAEELKDLENQFFGSQLAEIEEKTGIAERRILENQKQRDELDAARASAEARQAEIEANQPKERKELVKIKEAIRSLAERRSLLQKDLGRLEAQMEMAAAPKARGGHSGDQLLDLVRKMKVELERALEEDPRELHATVEGILEEIDSALGEHEEVPLEVPNGLRREFEKVTDDFKALDAEISALREKEQVFEKGEEGFYQAFKAAVADVQSAKNRIGEWENKNREFVLEKERLGLRHEEILRQIEQAGRRAEEFADHSATLHGGHDLAEMERRIFRLRGDLASIGEVDEALMKEAKDTENRYAFLAKESEDLEAAVRDLTKLMQELGEKIKTEFEGSLEKINKEFEKFFTTMFGGGSAKLKIIKPKVDRPESEEGESISAETEAAEENVLPEENNGIEIDVKLPRKKITSLDALSGGERSLVGIAAVFAMVSVSPPPFLVLDEVDAPLDERNAHRFADMLREFSKHTQFIVVTHNRATMEAADVLYGVTLDEDGTSKVVSLKFEE